MKSRGILMLNKVGTLVTLTLISACTTVNVSEVDASANRISDVCVERNERVQVSDFLRIVEQGFLRHGIETSVYEGKAPENCEYVLSYTAERGWDIKPFLDYAELRLKHRSKTIGTAEYRHSGGFGLNKWASTETKMTPVIDRLLAGYTK
jgi:hypothetical protein